MVASYETVEAVIEVVRKYVDEETFGKIVVELLEVAGNDSFEETMQRLAEKHSKKVLDF